MDNSLPKHLSDPSNISPGFCRFTQNFAVPADAAHSRIGNDAPPKLTIYNISQKLASEQNTNTNYTMKKLQSYRTAYQSIDNCSEPELTGHYEHRSNVNPLTVNPELSCPTQMHCTA